MRDFFKTFFASFLALGVFSGVAFVLFIFVLAAMGSSAAPSVPSKAVLVMDMSGVLTDADEDPDPSEALSTVLQGGGPRRIPFYATLRALEKAADDSRIAGVFLTGNLQGGGPAQLKELRETLLKVKTKKPVLAYNLNYGKGDYYLASAASQVLLNPIGAIEANGYASEPMFYGGAFKKYGIEVQVTRVGKYKSAVEPYVLEKMSPENREQIQTLLEDLWSGWKEGVSGSRKVNAEVLQKVADEKGVLEGQEAITAGLADRLAPMDDVLAELKKLAGKKAEDKDFPQVTLGTYIAATTSSALGDHVAVIYAEGEIVDGEGRSTQVGGERLSRELRALRQDPSVKAVVLRVNSPGGGVQASELIQREVILTKKVKPVVISMGHLAASGGYWISTYGNRIFAEPGTITGSIGVFGLLPNVKKLANEHGIVWDSVQTAKLSNTQTLARPKSEEELKRIQQLVDGIYDSFLDKVADSRHIKREAVHEIAQGRVWSGKRALSLGLVDELGGLEDAIRFAGKEAGLGTSFVVSGPAKEPDGFVKAVLKGLGAGKPKRVVKQGPVDVLTQQLKVPFDLLESLTDAHGVYARMPFELSLR
jgi:protease-4